jgi:hypothetical protein
VNRSFLNSYLYTTRWIVPDRRLVFRLEQRLWRLRFMLVAACPGRIVHKCRLQLPDAAMADGCLY